VILLKVAIVHEWLTTLGGSEKVVLEFKKIFPDAPIYTLFYDKDRLSKYFNNMDIRTSYLQKIPFAKKRHQFFMAFMPKAFEGFDLREYDLILSSSSAFSKGVITSPDSIHICYCHTPPRYIWDLSYEYLESLKGIKRWYFKNKIHYLRLWDRLAADRVDYFIANSNFIAKRIKKVYRRDSAVIFPPVDVDYFTPSNEEPEDYYLIVSRLVPYKRIDLAIEAFNKIGKKLVIIGDGPEYVRLKNMANKNIEFLGHKKDNEIREYYRKCKAFIFPGLEDFGITPVEAQACGRPVIAYGKGGVLDTVIDGKTGIYFHNQTVEDLIKSIYVFEDKIAIFDKNIIRTNAEKFSPGIFREKMSKFIENILY